MADWSGGYVTDLDYTYGFYRELTPGILSLALMWRQIAAPSPDAKLAYCELGCGQGMSANILAAANPHIEFHATDFNPGQIAFARDLAASARLGNMHFYEDSFAEFAGRKDLPDFDIIALHGIYSWVRDEYRANIRDIIRRRLKPGGIVYVSYNCLPGWAAAAPMRHLLYLHGKSSGGPTAGRVGPALDFVGKVEESGARYFKATPGIKERLENLRKQNHNYVAHEYMNDVWKMMYFSDVEEEMRDAKLTFAGSAHLLDTLDQINITTAQQKLLAEIQDPVLRESTRDYMVNQQFRRDVFVKGRVALQQDRLEGMLRNLRFALTVPLSALSLKIKGARGDADASPAVYKPVAEMIAEAPRSAAEIVADPRGGQLKPAEVLQCLYILTASGQAHPCLAAADLSDRHASARALNDAILQRAPDFAELRFLASPVTGGGVAVDRMAQLFLLAERKNVDPKEFADKALARRGEQFIVDGKPVVERGEHQAELARRFAAYQQEQLPMLKRLGIA
ncbi:class I SAM-dependent methyltransferase [Arvimicrobium flavum]|uniref:class I SAM-dependent methyltransferase n=1 Tax=Arvimicrobium flavum TaxID=3393320 RepID=UPI00237A277C|nr:class I SAM-dependent methyltransferase [Mesorhizobium shangrilense]